MKEFLKRILPRISEQSQRIDNLALLTNNPWVEVSEGRDRTLYIFRSQNNELLVSRNGEVTSCSWEFLEYANSLLIEVDGNRRLYQQGFIDPAVLVLRLDGQDEFLTLVNQNKIEEVQGQQVQAWLENKYLPPSGNSASGDIHTDHGSAVKHENVDQARQKEGIRNSGTAESSDEQEAETFVLVVLGVGLLILLILAWIDATQ